MIFDDSELLTSAVCHVTQDGKFPGSLPRPHVRTEAPSSTNASIMALPIPLLPPVTIAVLLLSLGMLTFQWGIMT